MLNLQSKDTFYVFDEWGMLTVKSDALSWRDSIGMTVCAWIAYGMPYELMSAIAKCFTLNKHGKFILYRHPNYKEKSSRDHWSYAIILRILYDSKFNVSYISTNEWINRVPRMRGMNLWMRSITGNKLSEWLYYTLYIPGARLGNAWLKFCRRVGRISEERDNGKWLIRMNDGTTYGNWMIRYRTRWQKLWAWIIFQTIPAYPLHNKGWQLFVMPESRRKERLKKILLSRIGISNILLRLLFAPTKTPNSQDSVTQEEIDAYPNMISFRPGVYLDETCRRNIREMTPEESAYNAYERDLLLWLWDNK